MKVGKWLALVLAAVMLLGLLAGCAGGKEQTETAPEPTADEGDAPAENGEEADDTAGTKPAFDEIVLADNDDIAVTVTTFTPDDPRGPAFTVLLENRTEADLYFTMTNVSVNDVMRDPAWGENVPAGESEYSDICWYSEDMASSGINYVEQVEALLWVYNSGDYAAPDVFEDEVSWSVDTGGMEGPAVREMVYDGSLEPMEILSGDITAWIVDYAPEGDWGPALTLYLENSGEDAVLLAMTGVSVNGVACDPYWSEDVNPGKIAYSQCAWWAEDLAEKGIDQIETVEFTFRAINYDGWKELAGVTMTVSVEGTGQVMVREASTVAEERD